MSNQICSMDKYKSMKKDKENQVNKNMNVSYHNSKQNNHDCIDKNKRKDFYSDIEDIFHVFHMIMNMIPIVD